MSLLSLQHVSAHLGGLMKGFNKKVEAWKSYICDYVAIHYRFMYINVKFTIKAQNTCLEAA
jgi:hypothetical protein